MTLLTLEVKAWVDTLFKFPASITTSAKVSSSIANWSVSESRASCASKNNDPSSSVSGVQSKCDPLFGFSSQINFCKVKISTTPRNWEPAIEEEKCSSSKDFQRNFKLSHRLSVFRTHEVLGIRSKSYRFWWEDEAAPLQRPTSRVKFRRKALCLRHLDPFC